MTTIIDLTMLFRNRRVDKALESLKGLENAEDVLDMIIEVIKHDVREALKKIYEEGEVPGEEYGFYHQIQKIYSEFAGGCFFCDDGIDPNENHEDVGVCMMCAHKLNKLLGENIKWKIK